jgi:putative copper export protein
VVGDTGSVLSVSVDDVRLFLHVLAATVWVGGQITLAGLVPVLRKAGADVPKAVARQFSRIAWPAFAVLIVTGIWNIQANSDAVHHDSDYRNTLMAKLLIVVLSGVSAYVHQRASTKKGKAIWGAATALFALLALFFGLILSNG